MAFESESVFDAVVACPTHPLMPPTGYDPDRNSGRVSERRETVPTLPIRRILVVDDSGVNRRMAQFILEKLGQRPDFASNGLEAIQSLSRTDYDVVFMDCEMPVMDGFEATRRIRQSLPSEKQPYIVAMTGYDSAEDQERCRSAGMDHYLMKPARIESMTAALAVGRVRPEDAIDTPPDREVRPELDGSALDELREVLGVDQANEIVGQFLGSAVARLEVIRDALGQHDASRILRAAHDLKSLSGTIGALRCARLAVRLEADAAQCHWAGVERFLKAFGSEFAAVQSALGRL